MMQDHDTDPDTLRPVPSGTQLSPHEMNLLTLTRRAIIHGSDYVACMKALGAADANPDVRYAYESAAAEVDIQVSSLREVLEEMGLSLDAPSLETDETLIARVRAAAIARTTPHHARRFPPPTMGRPDSQDAIEEPPR